MLPVKTVLIATAVAAALYSIHEGSRSTYDIAAERFPLAQAARRGDLELVNKALESTADVNQADDEMGYTALHWATGFGLGHGGTVRSRLAIVEALLKRKADPNKTNLSGETPLYRAVWDPELTEALLKGGAKVDEGAGGRTPLISATYLGAGKLCFAATDSMKVLIQAGANVNAQEGGSGWGALLTAVLYGCPDMVETLLKADADPNQKTGLGDTVLGAVERFKEIEKDQISWLVQEDLEGRAVSVAMIAKAGGHR